MPPEIRGRPTWAACRRPYDAAFGVILDNCGNWSLEPRKNLADAGLFRHFRCRFMQL